MGMSKKALLLVITGIVIAVVSVPVCMQGGEAGLAVISALAIAWCILNGRWWRCPHCGRHLGRISIGTQHCKYCGESIFDD